MNIKTNVKRLSILSLLFLISILSVNLYAASNNKNQPQATDSEYSEETSSENIKKYNPELQKIAERNSSSYWSRSFKDMFSLGAKAVYYNYEESTLFVKGLSRVLKPTTMDVVIDPKKNIAGIAGYYAPGAYYYFLMPEKTREALKDAMEKYYSDFDNKLLNRKDSASYKKYDNSEVEIEWGTLKSNTRFGAKGKAYFGYEFVKKSPYFVITLFSRANERVHESRNMEDEKTSSNTLKYYFTKAQLKSLVEKTSPEIISVIMQEYNSYLHYNPQIDSYDDTPSDSGDNY